MHRVAMSLLIASILSLSLIPASDARQAPTKRLTVYATLDTDWIAKIAQEFERETGMKVEWIRESAGVMLQRLKAEAATPKADVWFGGTLDAHAVAANQGLLERFTPNNVADLLPPYRNPLGNNMSSGLYGEILGFGVNEPLLKKLGKPVPRTWEDLLNPTYKGLVAIANPNTSGTGYTALTTMVKMRGEEGGFAYLKQLHPQIAQYTQSGGAPGLLVGKGEIAIAVMFLQDSVKQRVQGYPLTEVIPSDGTGYSIGGLSLVKGSPNSDVAKRFIEWALEPRVQQMAARTGSYQAPSNSKTQLDPNIVPLHKAKLIPLDIAWLAKERDRLLTRWQREVFAAAK